MIEGNFAHSPKVSPSVQKHPLSGLQTKDFAIDYISLHPTCNSKSPTPNVTAMSTRSRLDFQVSTANDKPFKLQFSDPRNVSADNLPLATWGSAQILANALHAFDGIDFSDTRSHSLSILELGAGTGLVGLSAAVTWRQPVCLTDLPTILPALEANIALNQDVLAASNASATCGVLDWSNPTHAIANLDARDGNPYLRARVILAADTVYDEDHPDLLTQAVTARLELDARARFIMCYPLRPGYLDHIRALWSELESARLHCLLEGKAQLDQSWDEDTPYEWSMWSWTPQRLQHLGD